MRSLRLCLLSAALLLAVTLAAGESHLFTVPPPAAPAVACGFTGSNGYNYDFSSLTDRDFPGSDGTDQYAYYLHLCGPLLNESTCIQADSDASACQVQLEGGSSSFVYGQYNVLSKWQELPDGAGVWYSTQGEQSCYVGGEILKYSANIVLECAQETGPLRVSASYDDNPCERNFTLPTPLACSGAPPQPSISCGWVVPGSNETYDFSNLTDADITGSDGTDLYTYVMRPCGVVSNEQCLKTDPAASACQIQLKHSRMAFATGEWTGSAPQWEFITPGSPSYGVQYTLEGAASCWVSGQPQDYSATVQFVCSNSTGPMTVQLTPNSCQQAYVYPTPLACPSEFRAAWAAESLLLGPDDSELKAMFA